ncbi:MAG: hypothetical protein LBL36_04060 [Clostridiales Family XIII bacterium]|nr:hypothetical protein [Clostridiales Family XIII bacterium]
MEIGFIDEEVKERKSSSRVGRFLLAGILLLVSLLVAREQRAERKTVK